VSRGYPSMTALLAVLAIAGYQNRDKIAEWLKNAQGKLDSPPRGSSASAGGGPPGNLGGTARRKEHR
jgi:hypothetical protein